MAPDSPAPPGEPLEPRPFAVLRRRLIVTNLLATLLVLLIVSVAVYVFEAHVELSQIDSQLASEASGQAHSGLPAPINVADQSEIPYDPQRANFFSIVVSPSGRVLQDDDQVQPYGLPDMALARPVLTGAQAVTSASVQRGDIQFRLYTAPIREQGQIVGIVQSGTSLGSYYQHLRDLSRALVALDLVIALLTLGSSVYLTERAMKPARAAFERQRQFAAGASHELRTPLALIRSLAELVADHRCAPATGAASQSSSAEQVEDVEDVEEADTVADDAREIIHEVDYMARLVTDLLLLARDERDRRALNWVTVELRAIIQGVVDKVQPLASARGVTLSRDLEASADGRADSQSQMAALVEGDPDRLRELALILIENAVRYTPRGGAVTVTVRTARGAVIRGERRGHVTLTVRDSGVGIAPEDQPHIFEPFYRASSSAMRRASASGVGNVGEMGNLSEMDGASGSGLGLALAHWIVEAHGGQISLASAPGKGTTFTVELPLATQAGRVGHSPGEPSSQPSSHMPDQTPSPA